MYSTLKKAHRYCYSRRMNHKMPKLLIRQLLYSCILALVVIHWSASGVGKSIAQLSRRTHPVAVHQLAHSLSVEELAFSDDGQWLASGGGDKLVKLWDYSTGLLMRTLTGHVDSIVGVDFDPSGHRLVSADGAGLVVLWEVDSGRKLRTLSQANGSVSSVNFSHNGRWVAAGGAALRVWNVESGQLLWSIEDAAGSSHAIFSPNDRLITRSRRDKRDKWDVRIEILEATTGRKVLEIPHAYRWYVRDIAFSPNGKILASASEDGYVHAWDVATGTLQWTLPHGKDHRQIVFSPNGEQICALGYLWDTRTQSRIAEISPWHPSAGAIAFHPDGSSLALGGYIYGQIHIWGLAEGREFRQIGYPPSWIGGLDLSRDGRWLATTSTDERLRIWDLHSGRKIRVLQEFKSRFGVIAFTPDSRWLASGGAYPVKVWDVTSGSLAYTLAQQYVEKLSFSADGRVMATSSDMKPLEVKLWNATTGRLLRKLDSANKWIDAFALRNDGSQIAISKDNRREIYIRDTATSRLLQSLQALPTSRAMAYSPDGRWLAIAGGRYGSPRQIQLWRTKDWTLQSSLTCSESFIRVISFSPDSRLLVSASDDGSLTIWQVTPAQRLSVLKGHAGWVNTVTFTRDGQQIVSAGNDGSVRVWNVSTGKLTAFLDIYRHSPDWLVSTTQGLFDGSDLGMRKLLAWRIGNRIYPPDRFFADYYTPGLLALIFAGEKPKPEVSLPTLKLPPDVRITSPTVASASRPKRIIVKVETTDLGGGTTEVRLYHNGKLVGTHKGKPAKTSEYEFSVDLVPGENILKATALNRQRVESNEDWVRIVYEAPKVTATLHLLVVGINEYEDPSFDLGCAKPDAEAIARFFKQQGKRLFKSVHVVPLFNKNATKDNIKKELNALANRTKPEDVIMVYMAGHGVGLGQQFYLLAHGMRKEINEEAAIRKYGVPASTLGDALRSSAALKQILILDTCQSETALPILAKATLFRGLGANEDKALKMLARSNGVYLIAASTKQQYAYEVEELGHGVLTYALLSGLGESEKPKAPTAAEGIVTVLSLLQYVNKVVPELTEKYHEGKKQYPVCSTTGMDFPLAVY